LGLPLSKKLAELLGGTIKVQSALGQGSVFSVNLPRIYRTAEPEIVEEEDWSIDPTRVPLLLLEDDIADAFAMQRALSGTGYQPIIARSVAGAKRVLERMRPAAALLDVRLGGDEVWRLILGMRQAEATGDIPIVVVSSTDEERKALHLGADAYLYKPIDPDQLHGLLDRLTGNRLVTRVLLVDDEEITRYLVRQLLPRGRYTLREAKTGTEGLAQLRRETPDILLLDLKMPEMTGFDLLEQIAAERSLDQVPAIVLTSMVLGAAERQRLRRAACIMSKSDLSATTLASAIADAVGRLHPAGA
ncbi:MAG: ATP-binding response regulator, partial [Bradyrhizobium sp.]